jgi:hypothetical protein
MRYVATVLSLCLAAAGVFYSAETTTFTDAQKSFWSLQPVKKPAIPAVKGAQAASNPIDAFVLAKLEENQLQPNKPSDKQQDFRTVGAGRSRFQDGLRPRRQCGRVEGSCVVPGQADRHHGEAPGGNEKPAMPLKIVEGMDPARAAAFVDLCQMLFASNEFLYIN